MVAAAAAISTEWFACSAEASGEGSAKPRAAVVAMEACMWWGEAGSTCRPTWKSASKAWKLSSPSVSSPSS